MILRAHGHDDVLLALVHVGHRRARSFRTAARFPTSLFPVALSNARNFLPQAHDTCGVPMTASLPSPMNSSVFVRSGAGRFGYAERRQMQVLQQRMIARTVAVGGHPDLIAGVEIERGDPAIRWLRQRQSLDLRSQPLHEIGIVFVGWPPLPPPPPPPA